VALMEEKSFVIQLSTVLYAFQTVFPLEDAK
jgi:hypothetical protein